MWAPCGQECFFCIFLLAGPGKQLLSPLAQWKAPELSRGFGLLSWMKCSVPALASCTAEGWWTSLSRIFSSRDLLSSHSTLVIKTLTHRLCEWAQNRLKPNLTTQTWMELPSLIYSRFYQGTTCTTAEAEAPESRLWPHDRGQPGWGPPGKVGRTWCWGRRRG